MLPCINESLDPDFQISISCFFFSPFDVLDAHAQETDTLAGSIRQDRHRVLHGVTYYSSGHGMEWKLALGGWC